MEITNKVTQSISKEQTHQEMTNTEYHTAIPKLEKLLTEENREKYDNVNVQKLQMKTTFSPIKMAQRKIRNCLRKAYEDGTEEEILKLVVHTSKSLVLINEWLKEMEKRVDDMGETQPPAPKIDGNSELIVDSSNNNSSENDNGN